MLLEMEGRSVKQGFIPNMGWFEYGNVTVKGRIIDPDEHGLLDGPTDVCAFLPSIERLSTLMQCQEV